MRMKPMMRGLGSVALLVAFLIGCAHADAGKKGAAAGDSYAKEGFHTQMDDGRLWVFRADSEEYREYKAKGKPARHVVRPGAGPGGITLRAVDSETIAEYIAAQPGFHTSLDKDGRLWVFRADSEEYREYKAKGKPAKHVVRPGAGPTGLTLKAVDAETLDDYLSRF